MDYLITPYTLRLALIVFIIATLYATFIAFRPFPDHLTWLSVVIGDSLNDLFLSLVIFHLTREIWLALLPWLAHAITGGPMIGGQIIKLVVFIRRRNRRNHKGGQP